MLGDERQHMPSVRNMMALRRGVGGQINVSYIFFCEKFLKHVVGVRTFNGGWKNKATITDLATPSDEALGLLLLENSENRWIQEFEMEQRGEDECDSALPKTKYTSNGDKKAKRGFTKKYGGWSNEGIDRFNELVGLVKLDRAVNGEWFDAIVLERIALNESSTEKTVGQPKHVVTIAVNDLFGESEDDDGDDDENECDDVENEEGNGVTNTAAV
jgi:hypothetical protein